MFMSNLLLWNDRGDMVNFGICRNYVFVKIIFKCGVLVLLSSQKYVMQLQRNIHNTQWEWANREYHQPDI